MVTTSVYAMPFDELAATVTPTVVEGTTDAAFPLTNINDLLLDTLWKAGSTVATELQWDFTAPRTIGPVALLNITVEAGSAIKVYFTSSAYPDAPTGAETYNIVGPTARRDGKRLSPFVDPSVGAPSKRYLRIRFPAQSAIPVRLGEVKIAALKRVIPRDFQLPLEFLPKRIVGEQRSDVDSVRVFDFGVTQRRMTVGSWLLDAAMRAEFDTLLESVNYIVKPFLFILDPTVQDAWLAKFVGKPSLQKFDPDMFQTNFMLEEVSGGVPIAT